MGVFSEPNTDHEAIPIISYFHGASSAEAENSKVSFLSPSQRCGKSPLGCSRLVTGSQHVHMYPYILSVLRTEISLHGTLVPKAAAHYVACACLTSIHTTSYILVILL